MKKTNVYFKPKILIGIFFLCFLIIFSCFASAQATLQSITNAIDSGEVSVDYISTGAASGHIADLVITSNSDSELLLCLEEPGVIGMVLENSAEDEQDEVIIDTPGVSEGPGETSYSPQESVSIAPGGSATIPLIGYCINYDKSNPTEGTYFTLSPTSDKTDISQISTVLTVLQTFLFPEHYTHDDIYNVAQIAIWASQSENNDVTLEEYASRGYVLDEDDISVINEILGDSGVDTTNIVALTGKQKEEEDDIEEESATTSDFPWVYIALPIIVIAVAAGIYAARSRTKSPGKANHVTSYSEPSVETTQSSSAKCKYSCEQSCTNTCNLQCETSCIARCEHGKTTYDPKRGGGVDCKKACMSSCTMKCTSWTQ